MHLTKITCCSLIAGGNRYLQSNLQKPKICMPTVWVKEYGKGKELKDIHVLKWRNNLYLITVNNNSITTFNIIEKLTKIVCNMSKCLHTPATFCFKSLTVGACPRRLMEC